MKKNVLVALGSLFLFLFCSANSAHAATWYVRSDGGTAQQCTGQSDASYPGSGTAQPCAFKNWYYLFGNDVGGETMAWKIAGGDTVIIGDTGANPGQFRTGAKGPGPVGSDTWAGCYFYECVNPTIPAGTSTNPTKIYGRNWSTSGTKTQIYGGYGAQTVLNLKGAQWVDVRNLEITDHGQCARMGNTNQCSSAFPIDDYARNGIIFNTSTSNINLADVQIHGMASAGIYGAIGGDITMTNVRIGFNTESGWDMDDGGPSTGGTVRATKLTLEWNGCLEEYPIINAVPAFKCFDDGSSGYGDAIGTHDGDAASFIIDQSISQYNTQDGLDLLHSNTNMLQITRSIFRGNMGQQVKLGAVTNTIMRNNQIIHNCNRMSAPFPGAPSSYNSGLSDFCRAAGAGLGINIGGTGTQTFIENNTYAGYGDTTINIGCAVADCSGGTHVVRNNIFYGYANPGYNAGQQPGFIYFGTGTTAAMITRMNNIIYNHRNVTCPTGYSGEQCVNPQLQNTPAFVNEASLDSLDLSLKSTSPARDAGVTIAGFSNDYLGNPRPSGAAWDIGAFEYVVGASANVLTSGRVSFTAANTVNTSFGTAYSTAPMCVVTPTFDVGTGVRYWVTSTSTAFTINTSTAVTGSFNYICSGN